MKLDREKFLAAALLLSATTAAPGCTQSGGANDKASAEGNANAKTGTVGQKATPAKLVNPPTREGVAPAKEGVAPAPAKEGVPAPTAEGTGGPSRPTGPIRMPGK